MTPKKLPNGKWQIRWRDDHGQQRARNFTFKADAVAEEAKILADLQRGTYIPPSAARIRLADWADQWLEGALNLGDGGRETYRRDLDRHILPELGRRRLPAVSTVAIETFLGRELDNGLAPSSVHRHYRTIRRMLQVAVDRRLLARNPCDPISPPRVPDTEMRFLDPDEIETLAAEIPARHRPWFYLATYGGPRWSECVGLRRGRVDGRRVTIAEQLVRRADGEWHRDQPKTRAGRRTITVPKFIGELLTEHLETVALPGPDGLVFPNAVGRPIMGSSFRSNVFGSAVARAGLGPVRIHDLRHTAVALAIAVGAHPKAIQARMGHASITTTLDRYGHLFPEMDESIADDLDRIRPEPPPEVDVNQP